MVILGHFLPFYHPKNPKNQNFEKWKNLLEISSFYTYVPKITIMYGSWDTEWDRQNFLSFWVIFCPFNTCAPPNVPENQNFGKKKWKCLEILSFCTYMCTINEDNMIYGSWNRRYIQQKCLSFWAILYPFSPLTTWKIQILKLKKTPGDIIILEICTINDTVKWVEVDKRGEVDRN